MYRDPLTTKSTFTSGLIALLLIDIALSFAYGLLPVELKGIRGLLDVIQFGAMATTMLYTLRAILEDF